MKRFKIIAVSLMAAITALCGVVFTGCGDKGESVPIPPPADKRALSVKAIDIPDSEEKINEITATEVAGVPFAWAIAWENAESEWATGKTLIDYIEFTTDGYKATVKALQAFGERAIISATWGVGNEAYTLTKSVDYQLRFDYKLSDDGTYYIVTGLEDNETGACTIDKIPETYNGLPVKEIGSSAFFLCRFTSITIPDSVTSIGSYAFHYCSSLSSIIIPDSVTSIGDYAFYCCRSLISVSISVNIVSIGYGVFCSCRSLASVIIPSNVISIKDNAFGDCTLLTTVMFLGDKSYINISCYAFTGCPYQP